MWVLIAYGMLNHFLGYIFMCRATGERKRSHMGTPSLVHRYTESKNPLSTSMEGVIGRVLPLSIRIVLGTEGAVIMPSFCRRGQHALLSVGNKFEAVRKFQLNFKFSPALDKLCTKRHCIASS